MDPYELPPGYSYELLPGDDCFNFWMAIVDRAGETVLGLPLEDWGFYYDAIETLWQILEKTPQRAGIHTAAFLTWRLGDSPLNRLTDPGH